MKNSERFRPFSHLPGEKFPLPYSLEGVQIFPAAICLLAEHRVIPLNIDGPVQNFTSTLDLERGVIQVHGVETRGHFRYFLFCLEDKIYRFQDRGEPVFFKDAPLLEAQKLPSFQEKERISFGSTKTLDWELVKRRANLTEILPIWFHLGQMIPPQNSSSVDLEKQFLSGFSGIFYPEKQNFLGYDVEAGDLHGGYQKIRSLLLQEDQQSCRMLSSRISPHGRALGFKTSFGTVDFEWTKHEMRRMWIRCTQSKSVEFHFPKLQKSCRLESNAHLKCTMHLNKTLDLRANTDYFLSHFQK